MTPDTPTTATAASIFEKYPRPWSYTGFDYRDAAGRLILTDEIPPMVLVSAVNATGTGDSDAEKLFLDFVENAPVDFMGTGSIASAKLEEKDWELRKQNVLSAIRQLRSALAAAREQHGAAKVLLDAIWAKCRVVYHWPDMQYPIEHVPFVKENREAITAALSPSQPTPDAGEKQQ